jgi:hypothetical protein
VPDAEYEAFKKGRAEIKGTPSKVAGNLFGINETLATDFHPYGGQQAHGNSLKVLALRFAATSLASLRSRTSYGHRVPELFLHVQPFGSIKGKYAGDMLPVVMWLGGSGPAVMATLALLRVLS